MVSVLHCVGVTNKDHYVLVHAKLNSSENHFQNLRTSRLQMVCGRTCRWKGSHYSVMTLTVCLPRGLAFSRMMVNV